MSWSRRQSRSEAYAEQIDGRNREAGSVESGERKRREKVVRKAARESGERKRREKAAREIHHKNVTHRKHANDNTKITHRINTT
ncbi:MAG: hypothetical protein V5A18_06285, partial [Haloarculaceae archaeon]